MKTLSIRALATGMALAAPLALGQSVPAFNVTDMWWNPAESGWAISMMHSGASNQVYALWHAYDSREPATQTPFSGDAKPTWIVMTGGTWTSPTRFVGDAFVTNGSPYFAAWVPGNFRITRVGQFTLEFTSASHATFTYAIAAPAGIGPADPAFGLPTLAGTKSIQRFDF